MEKEKTRGRTRRKQPSQVASFLYREGRRWFAAVLSLCLILNNMIGVTWAAQTAGEKEIWFKLTSSSLYEALQEAVRDGEKVNDHFLFEGKEKDVEAYEKLLLLDDDLYELKPEFENKDEVEDAENKKNLQLRIFASLSWEIDPEKEYQVAGDEKIIFYLSNGSETEQTAVIQVDEKTTEDITVFSKSAVVIGSENKEESLEAETEEVAETRENEGGENETGESETGESETGESKGQAAEENSGEVVKKQGSGGNSGALSGGNGGSSENSPSGNGGNSGNSGNSTETEISAEGGSFAGSSDEADKAEENKEDVEGEVQENPVEEAEKGQDNADNEEREDSKGSTDIQESIEHQGGEQGKAKDSNSAEKDKTNSNPPSESEKSEKPEEEGTEDKKTESVETGNKEDKTSEKIEEDKTPEKIEEDKASEKIEEDKASEKIESDKTEDEKKENVKTENTEDKKSEKSESSKSENADSEKPEKEKTDIKNADTENRDQRKEESERTETVKSDHADKPDRADKESSKKETSGKNVSENTKAGKEEKADTGKSENDNSGKSDNSKADKSNHSDTSSDNGKEVSVGISRNAIFLVTDNLEVSELKDASIADNDSTAVTASPSNIEDDEIEGELYEPVAIDEESVIVFVTTAEELGLNRAELRKASPSNAERISPAFEKEVELENVIVQVKADENILPEGVQLQVKELKEEGEHAEQYEEAKEALDSQGTEYDEMMAFDISFLDNKGREIEPDGNVQVSIKVKKEALSEEADLETISVQHLVEDEGEIFVEEVADCGNKSRGSIEVESEKHVEAAFEVDSFSVFTVTVKWVVNGDTEAAEATAQLILNFYSEDDNGGQQPLEESRIKIDKVMELSASTNYIDLKQYFKDAVDGYSEYLRAEFSIRSYQAQEFMGSHMPIMMDNGKYNMISTTGEATSIEIEAINNSALKYRIVVHNQSESGTDLEGYPYELWGTGSPVNNLQVADEDNLGVLGITLNLYYKRNSSDLGILNTIKENGLLTADRVLEEGQHYVWYKWEKSFGPTPPSSSRVEVERKQITGNKWNMDESKKSINVALDGGSKKYYQVEVVNENGEVISSQAILVDYYDKLENGSFQNPTINKNYDWLPNNADSLIWKSTTGTVEIVQDKSADHNLHIHQGGMHGSQCAELNSNMAGALYQDVLTIPGTTLHWSLLHRARGPYLPSENVPLDWVNKVYVDTMYVLIMPTLMAEEFFGKAEVGQDELITAMEMIRKNPENYPGASISPGLTSNNWGWYRKGGDYTVGDDQCLTRFFFIAGDTGSNDSTRGNLLDDVWFGTDLPPVSIEQGNLSITKVVKGLSEEDIQGYEIKVKVTSSKGVDLSGSEVFKENENGTYTAEVSLIGFRTEDNDYFAEQGLSYLPVGTYEIEEILPEGFKKPNISIEKVILNASNEIEQVVSITNGKVMVEKGKTTYIRITNVYPEESTGTILPDTGGPGLAMFERYGWFLLMLALLMAGVEVRCYGERKFRRASVMQNGEFDDPL